MIYKTLKKVSEYCQLLDKRNFPATRTDSGITFTNNGDGTITVNGTCTNPYYSAYKIKENLDGIVSGHKYAILGTGTNVSVAFNATYQGGYIWKVANNIFTLPENEYTSFSSQIRVAAGVSVSSITVKPQLFDLTEMYGAGNEPTTVEEFKEKFPNELYDYKPYCFVKSYKTLLKVSDDKIITSYKKSLVCKTKNLLDANKSSNASSNENLFDTFSINNNVITATSDNSTTKIATLNIFKGELPAGNYILSLNAVIENTPKHNRPNEIFIFKNGSFLTLNNSMPTDGSYSPKIKFTLSEKAEISIEWYKSVGSSQETVSDTVYKVTLSNIQLELGDTATEYHPYGYL